MKNRNIQQQQYQQDEHQYIGGGNFDIGNIEEVDFSSDELNSVDIPVLTPKIPNVETVADVNKQHMEIEDDIIIPESIQAKAQQQLIVEIEKKNEQEKETISIPVLDPQNNVQQVIELPKRLSKFKKVLDKVIKPIISEQKVQQVAQQVVTTEAVQVAQQVVTTVLQSSNSDVEVSSAEDVEAILDVVAEVSEAIESIPNTENLTLDNLVIVDDSKVKGDKTGYKKFKVTVKNDKYGSIISKLATKTKVDSKGFVEHRVSDLRVISNTNRKFLSGQELQLSPITFTFKPKGGLVNKSTRILVSIPDTYEEDGNVIVFIQKSRDKSIHLVQLWDDEDIEWLSKFMGSYFHMEFKMADSILKVQDRSNPLNEIIRNIIKSGLFKVAPQLDGSKQSIRGCIIKTSQGGNNEWLKVGVVKIENSVDYAIYLMSDLDDAWYKYIQPNGKREVTLKFLNDNLIPLLVDLFNKEDWSEYGIDVKDDDVKDEIMERKITYRKLKKAYGELYNRTIAEGFAESDDELEDERIGLIISQTLSKADIKKSVDAKYAKQHKYEAEAVVGKTDYLDMFVLTYLAVVMKGQDKRHGKDYITNQEYYEKYGVRDKREYQQRQRTVLKKEGEDRNYDARIFMFQLEYTVDGKSNVFRSTDWNEVKEATGFLTSNPKSSN